MRNKVLSICLSIAIVLVMIPMGCFNVVAENQVAGTLYTYPEFDCRIERDYMYSVSVTDTNGTTNIPVYNHTEDSRTVRNPSELSADEYRRFSSFAFEGTVTVNIKVNRDFTSYSVIPSAKGLDSVFDSTTGTIKVTLTEPIYFMVRLDDMDSTNIALLADSPETDIPTEGENTYIVKGWQDVDGGTLNLTNDNSVVYISPGAVLNARIKVTANNCKIIGRGALVDPYGDIYNYNEAEASSQGLLYIKNADNTEIDGIHLLNSQTYNVFVQGEWGTSYSENTQISNLKILSTKITSDGISFNYYLKNARAERCFVYCGDNALVYEDEAHYEDILIGTTCNAIFPQTDIINSSCENIHVFRADEGIINTDMSGSNNQTLVDNSTITDLYALDVTYTPYFIYIENQSEQIVSNNGGMIIQNVYLPKLEEMGQRFYYNVASANYQITLINVSVDGYLVQSIEPTYNSSVNGYRAYIFRNENKNWGWIGYPVGHDFSYTTIAGFNPNIQKHIVTTNYNNDINVFVGNYQVYFASPIQDVEDTIYLPYREIKAHLDVGANTNTLLIDGVEYIAYTELLTTQMVSSVAISENNLFITPINVGENLLVCDAKISKFTEYDAPHQHISTNDDCDTIVYTVDDSSGMSREGIYRVINEEIQKYGTGSYTLSFDVKTSSSLSKILTSAIDYGTALDETYNGKLAHVDMELSDAWQTVTMTFGVTEAHLVQKNLSLIIYDRDKTIDNFSVKNIALTKNSDITEAYKVTWNLDGRQINEMWVSGQVPQVDFDTANGVDIFSGWDKPITAVTGDVTYFAQYVSAGLNFVGSQVRLSDNAVRLVGKIDDYQLEGLEELGFEILINGVKKDCVVTQVYTSITANNQIIYADENNSESNTKFFTYCISEMPANTEFEVRVFAVVNGQRVTTDSYKFIFTGNDVIMPGINLRESNTIEDTATYAELFS